MLEDELKKATKILGIYRDNLLVNRYRVRHFDRYRQEILENLVELQKGIKPIIVFMPSLNDLHQDHHIVAQKGMKALKKTTILAYEMQQNNIKFSSQLFIKH